MSAYEMAERYYPRLWDRSRIDQLVRAGRLTEKEAKKIMEGDKEETE